ncbi:MAG TPA: STAS domain-containing protein [Acidobacteriota bacterium]|nr:STAS domain-containing protein [Acidobacteriota bacterium]
MKLDLIVVNSSSNIQLLSIVGNVEVGQVTPFGEEFEKLCEGPPVKLILDVKGADRIDSSGIGELIKARNDIVQRGGQVVLMGVSSRIERIINISGLHNYFPIALSVPAAIELLTETTCLI